MTLFRPAKITLFVALAAAGMVVGCDAGRINRGLPFNGDFSAHLAGEYELVRTSSRNVIIYYRGHPAEPHRTSFAGPVTPTEIVAVGIQGNFITACQRIVPYSSRAPVEEDYRYWIIKVREEQVQGPFAKNDFDAKCKELRIDSGGMKPVDFYRPS